MSAREKPEPSRQALAAVGDAVTFQLRAQSCANDGDALGAARWLKAANAALAVARSWDDRDARKAAA